MTGLGEGFGEGHESERAYKEGEQKVKAATYTVSAPKSTATPI